MKVGMYDRVCLVLSQAISPDGNENTNSEGKSSAFFWNTCFSVFLNALGYQTTPQTQRCHTFVLFVPLLLGVRCFVLFESRIRFFLFSILWQNLNGKDGGLGLVEVWFAQNSRQTSQYIALQLTDSIKGRKKEKHTSFLLSHSCVNVPQTKRVSLVQ